MKEAKNSFVSVIVPTYNSEKYIQDTMYSVIDQTYKYWEMLVIDDCSTDRTVNKVLEVIEKHPALNIKLIKLQENSGAAIARNKAILESNGKYIAFLDSDDLWKKDKLLKQVEFMKKNNYVFSYTNYELINEQGKMLNKIITPPNIMEYKSLLKNTAIGCLTVMLNIEVLGKMQMPNIRAGQDTAFWLKILKLGHTAHKLDENLSVYRKVQGSLSSNKIKALKRTWNIYRKVEGFNIIKSSYYFVFYLINAVLRRV